MHYRHLPRTANRTGLGPPKLTIAVVSLLRTVILHTHTHPFNGPLSGTTQVSRYQKGKTDMDFTEARDSEWQWHQLGHMQVCTLLQTDNHAITPPLSFLQAGCPSCRPNQQRQSTEGITAIGNMHRNLVKIRRVVPEIYDREQTNIQRDRHAHNNTPRCTIRGGVKTGIRLLIIS